MSYLATPNHMNNNVKVFFFDPMNGQRTWEEVETPYYDVRRDGTLQFYSGDKGTLVRLYAPGTWLYVKPCLNET